jgi:hypothetical protein
LPANLYGEFFSLGRAAVITFGGQNICHSHRPKIKEKAMLTITGVVGPTGKYLVTGVPISLPPNVPVKIAFECNTAGVNVALEFGTTAQFTAGTGTQISDSGGPGFQFLTLLNSSQLAGQVLWVRRAVGSTNAAFTVWID